MAWSSYVGDGRTRIPICVVVVRIYPGALQDPATCPGARPANLHYRKWMMMFPKSHFRRGLAPANLHYRKWMMFPKSHCRRGWAPVGRGQGLDWVPVQLQLQ